MEDRFYDRSLGMLIRDLFPALPEKFTINSLTDKVADLAETPPDKTQKAALTARIKRVMKRYKNNKHVDITHEMTEDKQSITTYLKTPTDER